MDDNTATTKDVSTENLNLPEAFLSFQNGLEIGDKRSYAIGVTSPLEIGDMGATPEYSADGVPGDAFTELSDDFAQHIVSELDKRKSAIFEYHTASILNAAKTAKVLQVPEGEKFDELKLTSNQKAPSSDVLVVSIKKGAELDLELLSMGDGLARTLIIIAEEDSTAVIRWSNNHALYQNVIVLGDKNSTVTVLDAIMPGKESLSHISAFVGVSANFFMRGVYMGRQSTKLDNRVTVFHEGNDSKSDVRTYGVLSGDAHIVERTLVDIPENLHNVSGSEDGRFVVLSKEARIEAIPALDIASGQVSCAHAMAIDTIDDTELYYPLLRGLAEDEARELLIRAVLIGGVADLPEKAAHKFGGRIGLGINELHL